MAILNNSPVSHTHTPPHLRVHTRCAERRVLAGSDGRLGNSSVTRAQDGWMLSDPSSSYLEGEDGLSRGHSSSGTATGVPSHPQAALARCALHSSDCLSSLRLNRSRGPSSRTTVPWDDSVHCLHPSPVQSRIGKDSAPLWHRARHPSQGLKQATGHLQGASPRSPGWPAKPTGHCCWKHTDLPKKPTETQARPLRRGLEDKSP